MPTAWHHMQHTLTVLWFSATKSIEENIESRTNTYNVTQFNVNNIVYEPNGAIAKEMSSISISFTFQQLKRKHKTSCTSNENEIRTDIAVFAARRAEILKSFATNVLRLAIHGSSAVNNSIGHNRDSSNRKASCNRCTYSYIRLFIYYPNATIHLILMIDYSNIFFPHIKFISIAFLLLSI